jgi:hypothetical protein
VGANTLDGALAELRKAIVETLGDYRGRRLLYFGAFRRLVEHLPGDDTPAIQYEKDLQALQMRDREEALLAFLTNAQRMAADGGLRGAADAIAAAQTVLCTPSMAHTAGEPTTADQTQCRAAILRVERMKTWLQSQLTVPIITALGRQGDNADAVAHDLCEHTALDVLRALRKASLHIGEQLDLDHLKQIATRLVPLTVDMRAHTGGTGTDLSDGVELEVHTQTIIELVIAGLDERHACLVVDRPELSAAQKFSNAERRGQSGLAMGRMIERLRMEPGRTAAALRQITVHQFASWYGLEDKPQEDWAPIIDGHLRDRIDFPDPNQPPFYLIIKDEQIWAERGVFSPPESGLPSLRLVHPKPVQVGARRPEFEVARHLVAILNAEPKDAP